VVKSVLAVPMERNVKGNAAKNVATKKLKNMRINEQDKENSLKCKLVVQSCDCTANLHN